MLQPMIQQLRRMPQLMMMQEQQQRRRMLQLLSKRDNKDKLTARSGTPNAVSDVQYGTPAQGRTVKGVYTTGFSADRFASIIITTIDAIGTSRNGTSTLRGALAGIYTALSTNIRWLCSLGDSDLSRGAGWTGRIVCWPDWVGQWSRG